MTKKLIFDSFGAKQQNRLNSGNPFVQAVFSDGPRENKGHEIFNADSCCTSFLYNLSKPSCYRVIHTEQKINLKARNTFLGLL